MCLIDNVKLLKTLIFVFQLTNYIERLIVESENADERLCVIERSLEIMVVLQELHNFNCVFALTAALGSGAVHRIVKKQNLKKELKNALESGSDLFKDHCKTYWEKLRSINPPCVPFYGQYQTKIFFVQEGNPDHLANTNLINFTKRRKVADIISEIQQYQNQPYCLKPYPEIRAHLESLDPFPDMGENEISNYLWQKSNEVEPKESAKKKVVSFLEISVY